ncbi:hypothetical protein [Shimia sediminis]|uniref:hypothetical protein n=1 Tax=Shimia sediminis TaxID=2497945 RepID=UPI000F8DA6BF|nr:hypothetical protein [Shimia sediminis]
MMTKTLAVATAFVCSASLAMAALPSQAPTTSATTATVESYDVAGTNGMDRRQDRRDTRQDCRQDNGAVGKDKRNCKQGARG